VGFDRQVAPGPNRQRHQEPLELNNQAKAAHDGQRGRYGRRRPTHHQETVHYSPEIPLERMAPAVLHWRRLLPQVIQHCQEAAITDAGVREHNIGDAVHQGGGRAADEKHEGVARLHLQEHQ